MSATRALLCCRISGPEGPSGFGFELTFRLKREDSDSSPPTWPAELMQGLARYVFQTGNILCPGDHVSWHVPLDNGESRLQHMLMAEDPQMSPVVSQCGKTQFVQVVISHQPTHLSALPCPAPPARILMTA
jgi:suppressor of fused-like protein